MTFKPLYDKLLIKPDTRGEQVLASGIIIPEQAAEKPQTGTVLAAGDGWIDDLGNLRKMNVKAGDKILYGKYSGTDVRIDGEERLILREADVIGILED